jgi:hypothetical protein
MNNSRVIHNDVVREACVRVFLIGRCYVYLLAIVIICKNNGRSI